MGKDILDLILTVEDTFGFAISDEDANELNTVGQLYEYVLTHRFGEKFDTCLTSIALYKIRRAMASVLGISRKDLRTSTELSAVMPAYRCLTWRAIEQAAGLRLPQLRRPRWVMIGAVAVTTALALAVPVLLELRPFGGGGLAALLTAIAAGYICAWLSIPLTQEFQSDCTTIGELAKATMGRNYQTLVMELKRHTGYAEVWETLQAIVAKQLGVRPGDIAKQTNFPHNLQAA
jgi:hypothetical protein